METEQQEGPGELLVLFFTGRCNVGTPWLYAARGAEKDRQPDLALEDVGPDSAVS